MKGYLDTFEPQTITLVLSGKPVRVERAKLGLHLALSRVIDEFDNAPGSVELGAAIRKYFGLLGVDIGGASAVEVLRAFRELRELNRWQWVLPFMRSEPQKEKERPLPYHYPDRHWGLIVHTIARAYGWSKEQIFGCFPEEAALYFEEILLSEWQEREFQHSLSEMAWRYDSTTKRSYFQEYPKLEWMIDTSPPAPVRIRVDMLPFGVKSLSGEDIVYH